MKRFIMALVCSVVLIGGLSSCGSPTPAPQWAVDQINSDIAAMQTNKVKAQALRDAR